MTSGLSRLATINYAAVGLCWVFCPCITAGCPVEKTAASDRIQCHSHQVQCITCLVSLSGSDQNSVIISDGTSLRHNLLPRTSGNLQNTAVEHDCNALDIAQQHGHYFSI